MNIFICFLLSGIFFLAQSGNCANGNINEEKKVSLNCQEQPLRSVLEDIRIKSGVNFIFQDNLIDNVKVSCQIKNSLVNDALKKVLSGSDISFKEFGEKSFVLFKEKKVIKKTSYKAIIVKENSSENDTVKSFVIPKMISKVSPVYPEEAVKNNIEGKVKLKFLVDKEGGVYKILIQQSSGSEILDSAAIDYINKLKFIPAKSNGVPRIIWMSMVLKYEVIY
jgi:TonB family protein